MKKIIAVDFYDLIWQYEKPFSRNDMEALFAKYKENGVDAVLWRLSVCGRLLYHTKTPDRYVGGPYAPSLAAKATAVMADYDPAEAAVTYGNKFGIDVYFWLTLYDDSGYGGCDDHESSICREHPEYSWREVDGKSYYRGVLSYVYPEVVEFRMRQIKEIISYGGAGLYLCNRSHSRPQVVRDAMAKARREGEEARKKWGMENGAFINAECERCKGRFGYDIPALQAYKGDLSDVVAWQRFRGTYFLSFMEKVRKINPGKTWFGLRYGGNNGNFIYGEHFFDWERLTDGTLIDALSYYLQPPDYDKPADFPEFYRKTKGQKFLWLSLSANEPRKLLNAYAESLERWKPFMDGIIMFEAYQMTDNPEYWDFLNNF